MAVMAASAVSSYAGSEAGETKTEVALKRRRTLSKKAAVELQAQELATQRGLEAKLIEEIVTEMSGNLKKIIAAKSYLASGCNGSSDERLGEWIQFVWETPEKFMKAVMSQMLGVPRAVVVNLLGPSITSTSCACGR